LPFPPGAGRLGTEARGEGAVNERSLLPAAKAGSYANMRSMGLAGSEYGIFLKQLRAGHLELALTYAAGFKVVPLADALRILELMAREGDQRFSRAASRWVERFGAETKSGLPEVQLAAAALGWLWENPESEVPMATLVTLLPD
jgi:hypothetical protein